MNKYRIFAIFCVVFFGQNSFAQDYEKGLEEFRKGEYRAALDEWLPAAENGDALAQYGIGFLFDKGAGVPLDDAEAERWYRRAVERGNLEADFALASMYQNDEILAQDTDEAYHWASLNSSVAFREIDQNYDLSSIHEENTRTAIKLFRRTYAREVEEYEKSYQVYGELFGVFFESVALETQHFVEERCNVDIDCHVNALKTLKNFYIKAINQNATNAEESPQQNNSDIDNETFGYRDFVIGGNSADVIRENCNSKFAEDFGFRCYNSDEATFVFFDENGELEDISGRGSFAEIASSAAVDFQGNIGVKIIMVPPTALTRIQIHLYPTWDSDVFDLFNTVNDSLSKDYQIDWQHTDKEVAMFDANVKKRLDKSFENGQVSLTLYKEMYACTNGKCVMVEYRNPKLGAQWAKQNRP